MAQYVKLGPKASFFRASSIDVSIAPGEVVGLNAKQMTNRTVRRALNGGHLVLTTKPGQSPVPEQTELTDEQLKASFLEMVSAGAEQDKVVKTFTISELTRIAGTYDIEVESGDTKKDIYKAILGEINQS